MLTAGGKPPEGVRRLGIDGTEDDDRRPPPAAVGGRVEVFRHVGAPCQKAAHDLALDPLSAPVDEANFRKDSPRFVEVFADGGGHVRGKEGMEVESVLERNADRFVVHG
jgi:hypothetical protein